VVYQSALVFATAIPLSKPREGCQVTKVYRRLVEEDTTFIKVPPSIGSSINDGRSVAGPDEGTVPVGAEVAVMVMDTGSRGKLGALGEDLLLSTNLTTRVSMTD